MQLMVGKVLLFFNRLQIPIEIDDYVDFSICRIHSIGILGKKLKLSHK